MLWRRVRYWFLKDKYRHDLQEEIQLHRELRARVLAADGVDPAEAAPMASRLFGNSELIKEKANEVWGLTWFNDFIRDTRLSGRMLVANRGFALTAILTLALGIGANTAIFSTTNALLLRSMPVRNPDRLFHVQCDGQPDRASNTGDSATSFSYHVFERLRTDHRVLDGLVAYVPLGVNKISVRAGSLPEEASGEMVSGNFFQDLGVPLLCGRLLTGEDETAHSSSAVINAAFALRHFGNACSSLNHQIVVKGVPFTIVGVTPGAFTGVESNRTDIWVPLQSRPELNAWGSTDKHYTADPNWWCLLMMARVKPDITKTAAEAALNPPFQHAAYEPLGGKPLPNERPTRLHLAEARGLVGSEYLKQPLIILHVMVGLLLLIACGNVSMLLAARNSARAREFSVRLALGGSRTRLFRQLLAESLALVVSGALLGLVFSVLAVPVLGRWAELETPLSPDLTVLLFTIAASVAASLLVGLTPAFLASRMSIANSIKTSGSTAFRERSMTRTGNFTAAIQLALCLILLVGTGLLVRTLRNLEQVKVGFDPGSLFVFGLNPQSSANPNAEADKTTAIFYHNLSSELRAIPGVLSVTLMGNRLASGWSNNTGAVVDGVRPQKHNHLRWNNVGPDFFTTIGIPILTGRDFRENDSAGAPLVAIVNQTFVKRFFNGRNAIGHTVSFTNEKAFAIVGVAEDSKYTAIQEDPVPMAWFPYTQVGSIGGMHFALRTTLPSEQLLPQVRSTVARYAPELALLQPRTLRVEFNETIATQRLVARLSMAFAALAIILVTIGLYGTISYSVTRRTAEVGIRVALGAPRSQVILMILRNGMLLSVAGIALGIPLALATTGLLRSLLFGVSAVDPLSIGAAALGILLIGLLATYIPARRASRIEPMRALRYE